jgi:hypothetical protein
MTTTTKARKPKPKLYADVLHEQSTKRKDQVLREVTDGVPLKEAVANAGVTYGTYEKWRKRDRAFAAQLDVARVGIGADVVGSSESIASFFANWFFMPPAWCHMQMINEMESCPPGHIAMFLMPPEHAKTTTYENYASRKLALVPEWRSTVASENITIARKIVSRVKNRLELSGPFPKFVRKFGPFAPQTGSARRGAQPWGESYFNVYKKGAHDERDYNMMALGRGSSIVSTRTDHLHCDDLQSTKTQNQTNEIEEWFRQDALSRPGTTGITTLAGTRVCEDDIYERLADDEELGGIMKVIRFPAIVTDQLTGEQRPLWPEKYTLDSLDMQRRKVGQEAWDRNYMQAPGASRKAGGAFHDDILERCKRPLMSLNHRLGQWDVQVPDRIAYAGLDPALGGRNCILLCEVTPAGQLVVRRIREVVGLERNSQIMAELEDVVTWGNKSGRVTDVVIEQMNFQKGLVTDERLMALKHLHGFNVSGHLTGWNKYDENIGVASMAESFIQEQILLPWADDALTRNMIGELVRQLKAWKPKARGNKLRQDMVMALWFVWILWRTRYKVAAAPSSGDGGWKREGLSSTTTPSGLILPPGVRLR